MVEADTKIRVRYSETDKMGFVYYGHYPAYYEVGRTELMRTHGLTYKGLEDLGILMPVLSLEIKYKQPAYYDDLLTIRTAVREMPAATIKFNYTIFRANNQAINYGETTLAFIKASNKRPTRPPRFFLEELQEFFRWIVAFSGGIEIAFKHR